MPENDLGPRLQRLVDRQAASRPVHSVVAGITTTGGDTHVAAAGLADAAGSVSMTVDTPYYLASITKMYTATVVMRLAASGLVDLAAPIRTYLPAEMISGIHMLDGTDHLDAITPGRLLHQTSGLADYFEGKPKGGTSLVDELQQSRDRSLTIHDIVAIVRTLRPEFPPGDRNDTKAHYSDTNYALLGAIIEAATGTTVAATFQEMIFEPLGLADTYVFDHALDQPRPAALFHGDRTVTIPLALSSFAPDGGVVATAADSLRFLRGFFEGELLTPDQLARLTGSWNRIVFPLQYGGGVMRFMLPRWMSPFKAPPELIGHSGSTGSFAFSLPKRAAYLVGTVNQMDKPGRPFRLMTQMAGLVD